MDTNLLSPAEKRAVALQPYRGGTDLLVAVLVA